MLAHVQVSLEASYISSQPTASGTPRTSRLLQTPRTGTLARPNNRLNPHPSILPPSTPNPMPSTGEQDRKYTTSEGTLLVANIWGSNTAEDSSEAFALLWSEAEACWIAVYRMVVTVCMFPVCWIFFYAILTCRSFLETNIQQSSSLSNCFGDPSRKADTYAFEAPPCGIFLLNW